jgi:hypothetical protein
MVSKMAARARGNKIFTSRLAIGYWAGVAISHVALSGRLDREVIFMTH